MLAALKLCRRQKCFFFKAILHRRSTNVCDTYIRYDDKIVCHITCMIVCSAQEVVDREYCLRQEVDFKLLGSAAFLFDGLTKL